MERDDAVAVWFGRFAEKAVTFRNLGFVVAVGEDTAGTALPRLIIVRVR